MSPRDNTPPNPDADAFDGLRHDLKTPLTTAYVRSQLVARMVRRSTTLTEPERVAMLESLTAIEQALRNMVPLIDSIHRDPTHERENTR
jgi:signal transduction histidine kinase